MEHAEIKVLTKKAQRFQQEADIILQEVSLIIVGQELVLRRLMIALLANGHILLEGVPGLAKTLMVRTLSRTLDADFCRIQFTPDLLPADIIGTKIYHQKTSEFTTKKGPIFANFILADEINRAPPKVQSALLEAMQEREVTISGDTFVLDKPFLVLATQNPIESEGTYRLPEAQIDRFMFKLLIDYPGKDEEKLIIDRMTSGKNIEVKPLLQKKRLLEMQDFTPKIYVDENIRDYVVDIIDATRNPRKYGLALEEYIDYGASPRASIWMIMGSKAHALLEGRGFVLPEDVRAVAKDVLRHRILLSYEAEAEDFTPEAMIDKILATIKVP